MTNKRKHYDVIIAFAEGETIEWRNLDDDPWVETEYPIFQNNAQYRVKPKLLCRYRVALYMNPTGRFYTKIASGALSSTVMERQTYFQRWLTDWIEVMEEEK